MDTPPVDEVLHSYERVDRNLPAELRALVNDDVIAEHQADPFGEVAIARE
jgi:hypothetical protein